jgi:hypothetical protein
MGRKYRSGVAATSVTTTSLPRPTSICPVRLLLLLLVAVYTAWVSGYDSNTNDLLTVGDAVDSSYVNTMTSLLLLLIPSSSTKSGVCKAQ